MQLTAWEFQTCVSPLPIVLVPQICFCLGVGCQGIYVMLVEVFCELQSAKWIYGRFIIMWLKK